MILESFKDKEETFLLQPLTFIPSSQKDPFSHAVSNHVREKY